MISLLVMPGTTRRGACVSPVTLRSILGERLRFTDQLAHDLAQRHAFFRVATVPIVSIPLAKRTAGTATTSMHPASRAAMKGGGPARLARPGFSPTAPRLVQSSWLVTWVVQRVVHHFHSSPSTWDPFTIPTTPWAPG